MLWIINFEICFSTSKESKVLFSLEPKKKAQNTYEQSRKTFAYILASRNFMPCFYCYNTE